LLLLDNLQLRGHFKNSDIYTIACVEYQPGVNFDSPTITVIDRLQCCTPCPKISDTPTHKSV